MSNGSNAALTDETTTRVALFLAIVSSFLSPFMISGTNVALPTIAKEFRMTTVLITWLPMVYILAGAIVNLPSGKLADIYGRKRFFTYGVAIFAVSSLFCSLSRSAVMLIVFRGLQGVGAAVLYGASVAILMSVVQQGRRGRAIGLSIAAVYVGLSTGPFTGGVITEHLGWRSIFLLSSFLGFALLVAVLWKLKGEWVEARGERLDVPGTITYCLGLSAVIYGLQLLPLGSGAVLLAAGIVVLVLFLRWEARIANPVLDWKLFRDNRVFAFSNLATFVNYSATFALAFIMSLYLQYIKHLSPQSAGLVMVSQPIVQAILTPYCGRLSDRIEPQILASWGMAINAAGLVLFLFLGANTPLWFVIATLGLEGLGFSLFSSPNTVAIMGSVDSKFYGVASGISNTMRLMGNAFSMGIASIVFSLCIGRVQLTPSAYPAFLTSTKVLFATFACLCVGGIFASLTRGKIH